MVKFIAYTNLHFNTISILYSCVILLKPKFVIYLLVAVIHRFPTTMLFKPGTDSIKLDIYIPTLFFLVYTVRWVYLVLEKMDFRKMPTQGTTPNAWMPIMRAFYLSQQNLLAPLKGTSSKSLYYINLNLLL